MAQCLGVYDSLLLPDRGEDILHEVIPFVDYKNLYYPSLTVRNMLMVPTIFQFGDVKLCEQVKNCDATELQDMIDNENKFIVFYNYYIDKIKESKDDATSEIYLIAEKFLSENIRNKLFTNTNNVVDILHSATESTESSESPSKRMRVLTLCALKALFVKTVLKV